MAKRKRLSFDGIDLETKALDPAATSDARDLGGAAMGQPGPASRSAPIAQVVGDTSAQAALAALTAELEEARQSGRLMLRLGLEQIEDAHLVRDRLRASPEDMEDLIASLRERGQQVPIEVTALPEGRFGLISGWRRVQALRHLARETGEARFAQALVIVRTPETLADAYRAMVEENEIRAGISYYERARIAALAAEAGIYSDARAAIAGLFAAASRAKRSKIGSFLTIWQHLDNRLSFAQAIPERLGLALARRLDEDRDFARRLSDRLRKAQADTAAEEIALLEKALLGKELGEKAPITPPTDPRSQDAASPGAAPAPNAAGASGIGPHREEILPGIWLETSGGFREAQLTLSGRNVDGPFRDRLVAWLRAQR